jgi:hypothetical protein
MIGRIDEIDRAACRQHVADHFSSAALVRGYDALLAPIHDRQVPTLAAPMVFSAPTPLTRSLPVHHDLPRLALTFTAPCRTVS